MDVENAVESDNASENNVEGVVWYYSWESDEHGFDAQKIPELRLQIKVKNKHEDVLEKIIGTGTCDDC